MSGRHQRAQPTRGRRRTLIVLTAIVVLATVGIGVSWALPQHHPARDVAAVAPTTCHGTGTATLVVDVAPELAVPVNEIAHSWTAGNPKSAGKCIELELDSDAVDQQELRLSSPTGANTDVWLPDSVTWSHRLAADQAAKTAASRLGIVVHPGVASSPLVAVTTPDRAAKLAAQVASPNFDPFAGAQIAAPTQHASGMLELISVANDLPAAAGQSGRGTSLTDPTLVSRFRQLSHATIGLLSDGFDGLTAAHPATFITSEQSVIAANAGHDTVSAAAVYPIRPSPSLDYPVIRLSRAGDDPALAGAADQFEKQLRLPASIARFNRAGLRAPDGAPVPKAGAAQGVMPDPVQAAPAPAPLQTQSLLRLWKASIADSNTLVVIDASGSMADPAGNGKAKIAVAAAAAQTAVSFFPDSSALGLWVFSSDQSTATPWAQLVPLGLLADRVGAATRRQALLSATAGMAGRVHGGTALYDTVLAAYRQLGQSYDPSKANSVVLLTDGKNDYTGGRSLADLLAALRSANQSGRAIQVTTIGIGPDADGSALTSIATATGGRYYPVRSAADVTGIFLDAVAQRR